MRIFNTLPAFVLVLTGCTYLPDYEQPPIETSHANAEFVKGYTRGAAWAASSWQSYYHMASEQISCDQYLPEIAGFNWQTDPAEMRRLPAGEPFMIFAHTTSYEGSTTSGCGNWAKFIPEAGAEYKITQIATEGYFCRLEVIDQATGEAPADLGHRLIKSQTDADSSEFDHGQIDRTAFVITRCDAPEVFDFVEEALDGIAGFVEVRTEADRMLAV